MYYYWFGVSLAFLAMFVLYVRMFFGRELSIGIRILAGVGAGVALINVAGLAYLLWVMR